MRKDSVHRCPPLVTRTIDCANWIMEPIASTYQDVSHFKWGPLLIQSHPSVQCSMILLIFTNAFVAVIDFFFSFFLSLVLYSTKRIHFQLNPSFIFPSYCMKRRRSAPFVLLPQSSYFWGPCSHVERLRSQSVVPASPRCAAGLMTNTWTLHMER